MTKTNYLDPSYLNITDRALVYSKFTLELIKSQPQHKEYLQYYEVVKESILRSWMVMYLPVGSIYADQINSVNLKLIGGGFYLQWYKANRKQYVKRLSPKVSSTPTPSVPESLHHTDDDPVPSTYNDLKMAFYILYIGLTLSTLCSIIEVVCHF